MTFSTWVQTSRPISHGNGVALHSINSSPFTGLAPAPTVAYGSGGWMEYSYYNTGELALAQDYSGGQDNADSTYTYDANGNRVSEDDTFTTYSGGTASTETLETANTTYDALNRITQISGTEADGSTGVGSHSFDIQYGYDANGNIIHNLATYVDATGASNTEDYWYAYDSMNRFVVTEGALSGGSIGYGSTGTALTYDADGNRMSATTAAGSEYYTYYADGLVYSVYDGGTASADLVGNYIRDDMGRVTDHNEFSGGTLEYYQTTTYDNNSLVQYVHTWTGSGAGAGTTDTYYGYVRGESFTAPTYVSGSGWTGGYYPAVATSVAAGVGPYLGGQVVDSTTYTNPASGSASTSTVLNQYDNTGVLVDTKNTYVAGGTTSNWYTSYDYNGFWTLTSALINDGLPTSQTVLYQNNTSGQVMSRVVTTPATGPGPNTSNPWTQTIYVNGVAVGDIGNDGPSATDYTYDAAMAQRANGTPDGTFSNATSTSAGSQQPYADFDTRYAPINNTTASGSMTGAYTVQSGDTLRSIAQSLWGDANLWYLIANANGLTSAETLTPGMSLTIPTSVYSLGNNSSTFQVYNPNTAIGDDSPTRGQLPQPAPPASSHKNNDCGGIGEIILAVVAIAVSFVTAGAALSFIAPGQTLATAGVAADAAAGAIGSAVGSIASQGLGLATGIQSQFNWADVGLAAIGGGVSGGLTGAGILSSADPLTVAERAATSNVISQGIDLATGLQSKFDWTGVATSAIEGGVISGASGPIGQALGPQDAWAAPGLVGGGADIAGAAARSALTGTSFGQSVIDELPNTISATIGNQIAQGLQQQPSVNLGTLSPAQADAALGSPVAQFQQTMASGMAATAAALSNGYSPSQVNLSYSAADGAAFGPATLQGLSADELAAINAGAAGSSNAILPANIAGSGKYFLDVSAAIGAAGPSSYGQATVSNIGIQQDPTTGLDEIVVTAQRPITSYSQSGQFILGLFNGGSGEINQLITTAAKVAQNPGGAAFAAVRGAGNLIEAGGALWLHATLGIETPLSKQVEGQVISGGAKFVQSGVTASNNGTLGYWLGQQTGRAAVNLAIGAVTDGVGAVVLRGGSVVLDAAADALAAAPEVTALGGAAQSSVEAIRYVDQTVATGVAPMAEQVIEADSGAALSRIQDADIVVQGGGCFVGGTIVHTRNGPKAIEAIQIGDLVLSQPQFTGELGYRRVNDTFMLDDKPVFEIAFSDASGRIDHVRATPGHPFWVKGAGWTGADDLKAGDVLELQDRGEARVAAVADTGQTERVFNFAVDGHHTYYVGEMGVWVHNASVVGQIGGGNAAESSVWELGPGLRGQAIEQALGQNLPGNFPVIDKFENGLATSIKSLDLGSPSYQDAAALDRTLSGYIDKVAKYNGTGPQGWAGVIIPQSQITGRALDLAIPNAGTAVQQKIINQAVLNGAAKGVTVNVIIYP